MNRIDIKLAIDMVVNAEENLFAGEADHLINTLEKCGNTLAAQAAMIEKLRTAYVELENFAQSVGGSSCFWEDMNDVLEPASCIANFGTDSKEVLKAWLDEVLGEPVAIYEGKEGEYGYETVTSYTELAVCEYLFRKPEVK